MIFIFSQKIKTLGGLSVAAMLAIACYNGGPGVELVAAELDGKMEYAKTEIPDSIAAKDKTVELNIDDSKLIQANLAETTSDDTSNSSYSIPESILNLNYNSASSGVQEADIIGSGISTITVGETTSNSDDKTNDVKDTSDASGSFMESLIEYHSIETKNLDNMPFIACTTDNVTLDSCEEVQLTKTEPTLVVEPIPEDKLDEARELERKASIKDAVIVREGQEDALVAIAEPDESYKGTVVEVTGEDRRILEHLVMGEAGNQGFEGAAMVAQCIRDTIVYCGLPNVETVRTSCGYSGSMDKEPNQDVLNAVSYIFDEGGVAVKHKMKYFYAPNVVSSSFHESQHFVIEYGGHKFFSPWE